ncbi:nuclear transport factor 2 family protein [Dysgonomonas sp. Marseille-P4677]|uniref:nuclear transport factor 2 family protein n=1 Tax=Dysgonomonas sp. Marseille-P4677 TaxID=2364790 RepID=UPI001912321C|nr:nuclear transport factor 2 family protein [Dysgonomonas sp. Marseille-P4677]MBK5721711.1 nuclear transport factor 2 family protein [Dysgonomonas sp. Marseille-P4677]
MDLKLSKVVSDLLSAQKDYNSHAYADCFSETALVIDEEKEYKGKRGIKNWIEKANEQYKTAMEPIRYSGTYSTGILTALISGDFDGSPIALDYHMEIAGNKIVRLEITVSDEE